MRTVLEASTDFQSADGSPHALSWDCLAKEMSPDCGLKILHVLNYVSFIHGPGELRPVSPPLLEPVGPPLPTAHGLGAGKLSSKLSHLFSDGGISTAVSEMRPCLFSGTFF